MDNSVLLSNMEASGFDWNAWLSQVTDDDWQVLFLHRPDLRERLQAIFNKGAPSCWRCDDTKIMVSDAHEEAPCTHCPSAPTTDTTDTTDEVTVTLNLPREEIEILRRLQAALPTVGLNGWLLGVRVLGHVLKAFDKRVGSKS